jgi:regulator of protease activity HflC (stomatin/prohibitin superfamily)
MLIPWIYFLKEDEQVLVQGFTSRRTVNGPGFFFAKPFERVRRRKGITLGPTSYLRVKHTLTGEVLNETGPKLYFPGANEEVVENLNAIPLKQNQYLRLLDTRTGVIRVERGEGSVYLSPTEKVLQEVQDGINIDEHTAVVVRDIETGQLELISEPQVFVPAPNQEIIQVSKRLRLEDHETVVIKDRTGRYIFKKGSDQERSFFLDPYSELVKFHWSTGLHKDQRVLQITHIDSRPKFMWYEFEARTQDNVELILGITFFWQITDVEAMLKTTDDTPGDICAHARSAIIQSVSRVTLEAFLAEFNAIVREAVLEPGDVFYAERGVKLLAIEVRSIACKDLETQHVLQEIIRETTNRINQLQKQESENEVKIKQINGEIETENMKRKLLEIQRQNVQTSAQMEGEAEALKVKAFFEGLGDQVPAADGIAIFNTLRKQDVLEKLSQGTAQLYFTPAEVDLSIETRQNVSRPKA